MNPNARWVAQQARQLVWMLEEHKPRIRFLLRDNDTKFTDIFDTIFQSAKVKVIPLPYRDPNANAFAERWVRTVREECLDKIIVLNQEHLRQVLKTYITHYNHSGHIKVSTNKLQFHFRNWNPMETSDLDEMY